MKPLHWLCALLTLAITSYALAPEPQDKAEGERQKQQLASEAEKCYSALLAARENAVDSGHSASISIDATGWTVQGAKNLAKTSGKWGKGVKIGTNIQGGRISYDKEGNCLTDTNTLCKAFDPSKPEPEAHVHEVTIASDAHRIYTIFFDATGQPIMEFDDF